MAFSSFRWRRQQFPTNHRLDFRVTVYISDKQSEGIKFSQLMEAHQILVYERSNRVVYELDGKHILKIGKDNPNEAETMKFVRENTTLPVPEVIDYWTYDGKTYILMEKMPGITLESVWSTLGDDDKRSIMSELRRYVEEIRKIEFNHIGAVNGNLTLDYRISSDLFEPLYSLQDMYKLRFSQYPLEGIYADYAAEERKFDEVKFVLCHTDLGPYNILVEDGRITAILDWEGSGCYPEFWEYSINIFHRGYGKEWKNVLEDILKDRIFDDNIKRLEWFMFAASVFTNIFTDDEFRQETERLALDIVTGKKEIEFRGKPI